MTDLFIIVITVDVIINIVIIIIGYIFSLLSLSLCQNGKSVSNGA